MGLQIVKGFGWSGAFLGMAALSACVSAAGADSDDDLLAYTSVGYTVDVEPDGSIKVVGVDPPIGASDKARAVEIANQPCGDRGVETSDGDRFELGVWIFPGGCR